MLVSGYLTWIKLTGSSAALCVAGGGCDIVQASRYALFLGVPTALWGLAAYAALAVLAWLGLEGRNWMSAFVIASGSLGFSLYLTGLSVFDLHATCAWCLTSAAIVLILVAVLLARRPAAAGRKRLHPGRLATYAVGSALAAVVAGAFVFAAPFSAPADYPLALARHLVEIKAVMYGAFW
jgi:uncharacterized membrane protein